MQDSEKSDRNVPHTTYKQSREYEVYKNLAALKSTFATFQGNFNELINWLQVFKDPEKLITSSNLNDETFKALFDETNRKFHNFLSSAKTLVEHTRIIVNRLYSNHEFLKEYQIKLKQDLAQNSLQLFVQRLRNYTQHYKLPILFWKISAGSRANSKMEMDVDELRKWDDWGNGKPYLDTYKRHIDIEFLSKEYYEIIESFYKWLDGRQQEIHKFDLENLSKMKKKIEVVLQFLIALNHPTELFSITSLTSRRDIYVLVLNSEKIYGCNRTSEAL